jgi:myo-inositol-1(or 4)-monophosphatase
MTSPLFDQLLELAVSTAKAGGALLATRPAVFDVSQKSSAVDFATQMDIASEKLIVETILAARPDDGIIGEEGSDRASTSGYTWVIDPLDGTVNYFYGLPGWNVSIAVKDKDGVVAAAVYAPSINSLWTATRGGGAFLNGDRIFCNDPITLDRALLGTGFSYNLEKREEQATLVARLIPQIRDLRRNGAAAVDLCSVAMGALDGYYEMGLKEWDLAAGGLIAREAGAMVTGRGGGLAGEAMVIAAGPALHARLVAEVG